jgi:hypothetical protein
MGNLVALLEHAESVCLIKLWCGNATRVYLHPGASISTPWVLGSEIRVRPYHDLLVVENNVVRCTAEFFGGFGTLSSFPSESAAARSTTSGQTMSIAHQLLMLCDSQSAWVYEQTLEIYFGWYSPPKNQLLKSNFCKRCIFSYEPKPSYPFHRGYKDIFKYAEGSDRSI